MLARIFRPIFRAPMEHLARRLHALGVTPNTVSFFGFLITVASAILLAGGELFWGGIVLLAAAMFDILDGTLARYANQESKFGAFLDSTLDRYSESISFLGLAAFYANGSGNQLPLLLIVLTLIGSWSVSYTRARAEGLNVECKVGILQRPERMTILITGLILGLVLPALWILAVLTNVTGLQRIYEVYLRTAMSGDNQLAGD